MFVLIAPLILVAAEREPKIYADQSSEGGPPETGDRTVARKITTLGKLLRDEWAKNESKEDLNALVREDVVRLAELLDHAEVWVVYDAPPEPHPPALFRAVESVRIEVRNLKKTLDETVFESIDTRPTTAAVNDNQIDGRFLVEMKLQSGVLRFPKNAKKDFNFWITGYNLSGTFHLRPDKPGTYDDTASPTTTQSATK